MTRIKVSGLTDPADAELAVSLGVDIVACVFHAASPRYVTITQALAIRQVLPSTTAMAGIFVDAPTPLVRNVMVHGRLDMVQLFGAEPRSAVDAIGRRAFKAVTVRHVDDLEAAVRAYVGRRAKAGDRPALLLNLADDGQELWTAATEPSSRAPLILAGRGLDTEHVAEAIRSAKPWGVDAWDAVERRPGRLDPTRLTEFVAAARAADEPRSDRSVCPGDGD